MQSAMSVSDVPSSYAPLIRDALQALGRPEIRVRLIEGLLRVQHRTLGHLSAGQFRDAVAVAIRAIDQEGDEFALAVADALGL